MPKGLEFHLDDFVKVVSVDGAFRYGYIASVTEEGQHVEVCMHEEGDSKIAYDQAADPGARLPALTACEKKALRGLADGLTTAGIGQQLHISPITVRAHIRTLKIKFGLESREQLTCIAQAISHRGGDI